MRATEIDPHVSYLASRASQRKTLHRIQSQISRQRRKGVKAWAASFIAKWRGTRSI